MISVTVTGSLFGPEGRRAVQDLRDEIEYVVSWQGFAEVRQITDASFKHPTPYYEVQITNERKGDEQVIHDRGIVYGPWLERGSPTTRFRGYHSFRRATQALLPKVMQLCQHVLPPFLRRLNGQ